MPALRVHRQELFCQQIAKGKTQDEAYALAGFKPDTGNACRLRARPEIAARIAEILKRAADKAVVTVATIAEQLDEDRGLAHRVKQSGAAVAASVAKAKLFGLMAEKHEHGGPDGGPIKIERVIRDGKVEEGA